MNWLGSVRQWHWVSSAVCLIGMLGFSLTGITLNHAGQIEASPTFTTFEETVPDDVLAAARAVVADPDYPSQAVLPEAMVDWLARNSPIRAAGRSADWSDGEVYLAMARAGGDAWLSIDLDTGKLIFEDTHRGWVSFLNDLHKGRNTGAVWSWFIDLFSIASVIFCVTGLVLLYRYRRVRPLTWPAVGLGFLVPALLALLFVHQ